MIFSRKSFRIAFNFAFPFFLLSCGARPYNSALSDIQKLKPTFVQIPSGTFLMGSPGNEPNRHENEGPQHLVTISRPFEMQATEMTQFQWVSIMGSNTSKHANEFDCPETWQPINQRGFGMCPYLPVERMGYDDIQKLLTILNATNDGYHYSLPTEAEWEYAARAGSTKPFSGSGDFSDMCWFQNGAPHSVAAKQANQFGLYDMCGNVWEWTSDFYAAYESGSSHDPSGPSSGSSRVWRGGSWNSPYWDCRSAVRTSGSIGYMATGFRLVRRKIS